MKYSFVLITAMTIATIAGCGDSEAEAAKKAADERERIATEAAAAAKKAADEKQRLAIEAAKKDEDEAKKAVISVLKDPESARFGKFDLAGIVKGNQLACLTVNAKNSYGGYSGDREAILAKIDGKWDVLKIGVDIYGKQIDHQTCIQTYR